MRPVFLDVELSRNGALKALAALGPDGQEALAERAGEVPRVLQQAAGWGADLLVGHNLGEHDRPWLARYAPGHSLLRLPWIDTLVLSPLAFPERPYHRLVKEHRLVRESLPEPLADCRATRVVIEDELRVFTRMEPTLRELIRAALPSPGYAMVLGAPSTGVATAWEAVKPSLAGRVCETALAEVGPGDGLALAYVVSWLRVPPGSRLPAWTRKRHPETERLVRTLRGRDCGSCEWCAAQSPEGWLKGMFGHAEFRPFPADADGGSLQRRIVAEGMADRPLYAVLPTGTGKSACFQIPAAARHRRTGDLTVVISPLQSLMKDQVDQLHARDPHATTVNGSLSMPERTRALEEVYDGWTSLVYISPEQLRNPGVRKALAARTIGAWVIDEAHCLTEWGHDFRADYMYVPRFARELAQDQGVPVPPFQCFTGTSQPAVTQAIRALLQQEVGQQLALYDGGSERTNLTFAVEEVPGPEKLPRVFELLETLERGGPGAAIVFTATRGQADRTAVRIADEGWAAAAYHAGLDAQERRDVQDRFLRGDLQVISATSAFGMGVDKADVRLVVHLEVPASLESYLQQAGRAGRDGAPARCVLLFEPGDVDRQFRMAQLGALSQRELEALWRGLSRVPARRLGDVEERVVTRGELARLDAVADLFDPRDPATDTRISAAVSWLERAGLFVRDENHTHVFQGRPRLPSLEAATERVRGLGLGAAAVEAWRRLLARLYAADADEGLSADDLAEVLGEGTGPVGGGTRVLETLRSMVDAGLITGGAQLSAFLAWGVVDSSRDRLGRLLQAHSALLALLPELANGEETEGWLDACPSLLAEALRGEGNTEVTAQQVVTLLRALERDGLGLSDLPRSLDLRFVGKDRFKVRARRPWREIARLGQLRSRAMGVVIDTLEPLVAGTRGKAVLVGFGVDALVRAFETNLLLAGNVRSGPQLADQALLLLHDARVLTLQGGLSVFRQAMVLRRPPGSARTVKKEAIEPLLHHQDERTLQIHVMSEYAKLGAAGMDRALELSRDWFGAPRDAFLERWFRGRRQTLKRPTSEESYGRIVGDLTPEQREVVCARPDRNLLILAGPGSGKTRVLVHRVAWLIRVRRVRPEGILVVCYTRANAVELRRRLRYLIGDEGRGVTVSTLHGLALRLTGRRPEDMDFDTILEEAVAVLRGERTPGGEPDEARDLALRGATHLLVDEYQDLDERQARLVEAVAGRVHPDEAQRLTVFAVGDDDQAIFGWRGGSARWIREFGDAWSAEQRTLLQCHRCTAPILAAAEQVVRPVAERLKAEVRLVPRGEGEPIRRWRTQNIGDTVRRLVDGNRDAVVLGRTRAALAPVRAALEEAGIPVEWPLGHGDSLPLARVREVMRVLDALDARAGAWLSPDEVAGSIGGHGPWCALLERWRDEVRETLGDRALGGELRRALWEQIATERGERTLGEGVRLGTLHGAKGLEWKRVILVDDGDPATDDETRRLWYVGMTRASERLDIVGPEGAILAGIGDPQAGVPGAARPAPRYEMLGLDQIWLDRLGRDPGARGHAVLEELAYGEPVEILDGKLLARGTPIAWVKRSEVERWTARGARLRFVAAILRERAQSDPAFQERLGMDRWWVPVCEAQW